MTVALVQRFRRDRTGAATLEFALIAVPLVVLLFGGIEISRAEWTRQALRETAISAARCIGVGQSECADAGVYSAKKALEQVKAFGNAWGLALDTDDITLDNKATCNGIAGFSQVQISYRFETAIPEAVTGLLQKTVMAAEACFPNQSG
jgi:Flp pilus assembly protein TadG